MSRLVVALGGNALLRRSERADATTQRRHAVAAAASLAAAADEHELVVTHGNGPQVGLLALEAEAYEDVPPYPLDVLGAESQGMIGYILAQALANASGRPIGTVLTQVRRRRGRPGLRRAVEADRPRLRREDGARTRRRARLVDRP